MGLLSRASDRMATSRIEAWAAARQMGESVSTEILRLLPVEMFAPVTTNAVAALTRTHLFLITRDGVRAAFPWALIRFVDVGYRRGHLNAITVHGSKQFVMFGPRDVLDTGNLVGALLNVVSQLQDDEVQIRDIRLWFRAGGIEQLAEMDADDPTGLVAEDYAGFIDRVGRQVQDSWITSAPPASRFEEHLDSAEHLAAVANSVLREFHLQVAHHAGRPAAFKGAMALPNDQWPSRIIAITDEGSVAVVCPPRFAGFDLKPILDNNLDLITFVEGLTSPGALVGVKADPPNESGNQGFLLIAQEKLFVFSPYFNMDTNFFQFGIAGREGSARFIEAVKPLTGVDVEPLER